jgi:uncharacterized metal-binding protein YceD (DUF177 family)
MTDAVWSAWRTWGALRLSGQEILAADEASRAHLSRRLDLEALDVLEATVTHEAWLDGARVHGRLKAVATRLCGVSLEPFEERVDTGFDLRFVPEGSPNAPAPEDEIIVTLETDDPPELVKGGAVDLAAYIVEALILALDPFPRKPGVVFDYVDPSPEASPFAILKFPGHDRQK